MIGAHGHKSTTSWAYNDSRTSLDRYLTLLEHVFLVRRLPAYHTNRIKQITKAPKLLLSDSALLAHVLRAGRERLADDQSLLGTVLECFVGMELAKQLSAARTRASLLHMRTATGAPRSTSSSREPTAAWPASR